MVDEERAEREYKAALRELKILERKVKLIVAATLVLVPFLYVIGSAVAATFGHNPAELPWHFVIPCVALGLAVVLQADVRDVAAFFGGTGAAVIKAVVESAAKAANEKSSRATTTEEEA